MSVRIPTEIMRLKLENIAEREHQLNQFMCDRGHASVILYPEDITKNLFLSENFKEAVRFHKRLYRYYFNEETSEVLLISITENKQAKLEYRRLFIEYLTDHDKEEMIQLLRAFEKPKKVEGYAIHFGRWVGWIILAVTFLIFFHDAKTNINIAFATLIIGIFFSMMLFLFSRLIEVLTEIKNRRRQD